MATRPVGHSLTDRVSRPGLRNIFAEANDVAGTLTVAEYPVPHMPGHLGGAELVAQAWQLETPDSPEAECLLPRHVLTNDYY